MKQHIGFGLNIDHVATLRQARGSPYPDPVAAAVVAELAGADQITCHLRSDRRHILDADLPRLRDAVQTLLNVEIAMTEDMLSVAVAVLGQPGTGRRASPRHPHRVTLVPEREGEVTTEGGLDVLANFDGLAIATTRLREAGLRVSLFVDPEITQVEACSELRQRGADMVELNTARFAEHDPNDLGRHVEAARYAAKLELAVAAGHGLTHHNLGTYVRAVPELCEVNIGHSVVARAVFVGLEQAVRDLVQVIRG